MDVGCSLADSPPAQGDLSKLPFPATLPGTLGTPGSQRGATKEQCVPKTAVTRDSPRLCWKHHPTPLAKREGQWTQPPCGTPACHRSRTMLRWQSRAERGTTSKAQGESPQLPVHAPTEARTKWGHGQELSPPPPRVSVDGSQSEELEASFWAARWPLGFPQRLSREALFLKSPVWTRLPLEVMRRERAIPTFWFTIPPFTLQLAEARSQDPVQGPSPCYWATTCSGLA